jgi:hypothetical protein
MMCDKCSAVLAADPAHVTPPWHLTHPRDASRTGVLDVYGFARCPECLTLWYSDVYGRLTVVAAKGDTLLPRKPLARVL